MQLLFLFIAVAFTHPLCYDGNAPVANPSLEYCTEYRSLSCCTTTARETAVVNAFLAENALDFSSSFVLGDRASWSACDQELINVACTKCSQYESHLYETSADYPILCGVKYCNANFTACAATVSCAEVGIVSEDPWCYPIVDPPLPTSVAGLTNAFPGVLFAAAIDVAWATADATAAYVATQTGFVYRVAGGTKRTFLDLTSKVSFQLEMGFLGFVFDPNYATNCYVYAFYTGAEKTNYLSRFYVPSCTSLATATVSVESECALISIRKTTTAHNGGSLHFDSHGDLYLSLGDGGTQNDGSNNGQNTYNLFASVIRITPGRPANPFSCSGASNYTIPSTNPFVNGGGLPEIYAYGLRNPWTCTFVQPGDKFYCGDVGQQRFEEFDRMQLGGNYGWSKAEGDGKFAQSTDAEYAALLAQPNYVRPLADYRHSGQYPINERTISNVLGFSIIYGGPYFGSVLNSKYRGAHIFADYNEFSIGIAFIDETGNPPRAPNGELLIVASPPISRVRYGPDGEPYFVSYYGPDYEGAVFKFTANKNVFLCGNYLCETGETCTNCPIDCQGQQTGPRNSKWCCASGVCASGNCPVDCSARLRPTNPQNKVCEPNENCLTTDDCPGRKNNNEFCCYGTNDGPVCASPVADVEEYNSAYCLSLNDPCNRGESDGRGNGWAW